MYYLYILYSARSDRYYVGYSKDPIRRLEDHNSDPRMTYTHKHRPWELKVSIAISEDMKEAVRVERYVKSLKSRRLIEEIISRGDIYFIKKG